LRVGFCVYSSSNTKAQILAPRFPISRAKAHIFLKSRQLRGKTFPTSLNSEMEFTKVSHEFRDLGLKPHLYSIIPITPLLNLRRKDTFESPEIRSPMLKLDLRDPNSDAEAWCPENTNGYQIFCQGLFVGDPRQLVGA